MGKVKDLTGQRFCRLVVIRMTGEKSKWGSYYWLCKCDCGNEKILPSSDFKGGNTKSCGCLQKDLNREIGNRRFKDIKDQKFGKLTVIKLHSRDRKAIWECLCDCGNTTYVEVSKLMSGHTKSCGCYKKEWIPSEEHKQKQREAGKKVGGKNKKDWTGKRYHHLTFIKSTGKRKIKGGKETGAIWLAKCDCGNYIEVVPNRVVNGYNISCGCKNSKGNERLRKELTDLNITFTREKIYKDCRDKGPLRFDFYLPDYNLLIEYQGQQHYGFVKWKKTDSKNEIFFEEIQKKDKIKVDYCKEKGIKLLLIPYWDFKNIKEILIEELNIGKII